MSLLAAIFGLALLAAACETDDVDTDDPTGDVAEDDEDDEPDEDEEEEEEDDPEEEDEEERTEDEDDAVEAEVDEAEVDEDAFYHDVTLELFMPFDTGGGTDTQGRFLAPYMADNFPGNPTVQPVNVPGAGGLIANNEYQMEKDHEAADSILFSSASSFFPWVFQEEALELDYEELVGLMAIQTGALVYANVEETGIESTEDFVEQAQDVEWIAGEQTPDSLAIPFLLGYDMLEIDHDVIMGYEGRGPARSAFEGGELNINWDTTATIHDSVAPLFEDGTAAPLFSMGQVEDGELVDDDALADAYDVPPFHEVYEEIHGEPPPEGEQLDAIRETVLAGMTVQKVMWLHQDAPEEAVQEARDGFEAITEDEQFQEEAPEVLDTDDYDIIVGDEVDAVVDELITWDEDVQNYILDFVVENYDHPDPRE